MSFKEFLSFPIYESDNYRLTIGMIILAVIILVAVRIVIYVINRLWERFFIRRNIDVGRRYAIRQFTKYILYVIALLMALQAVGIQFSILLGGAAALLVGIGLGLQQTFNDLISGIILLTEGTVEVGDMVDLDNEIAKVKSIGFRTSKVETRNQTVIIIPNSKLVGERIINWSNNRLPNRFFIDVGVAYGSDVKLVRTVLEEATKDHQAILKSPPPKVQFINFGDSSLDFRLYFFSNEFLSIEFVKSDIRFKIVELFIAHHIEIPFPQRDVWLKTPKEKP